jgi:ABC-type Fe3+/spermidine/putrescine transport system ATPase subunit
MVAIKAVNICKSFNDTKVLDDISFFIEPSKISFLLGSSGCGKTTLLRIIAGLEKLDSGTLFFDGIDVTDLAPGKRNIGMVFQQYFLWPHMTVAENIAFGLKIKKFSKLIIHKKVSSIMEMMKITGLESRYPHQLSGGQQQRVALARAVVVEPKLLLMDEPLSNIDPIVRGQIRIELKNLIKELNLTAIIVSHDKEDAESMSDLTFRMNNGKIISSESK